ncbi:MAG: STAS domain-containing protein [Salibacteraceae bacterium]|jgi:anti-sigma B factor antagonist|nr:STAS domain-containing protein [Salibacteraceae bacterium]MDP4686073.1 STAS domain-containing protein [Salibacteraceae bacterium]MDP4764605.1 STAS domain-containing protein [Salibacteraceae bacterium]MDP4844394.1 STAS domain-containing protein [Salibacteraceae bacterium]MDP4933423.1 STAS domain-containing protein [Salibacteraceae bacterium]
MNFTVEKRDKYSIIKVETEKLGGLISPELKAKFVEVNGLGERNIILNMNNARYCDSSGLSAILVGNRLCKNSNGSFVMCGLSDMVQKLVNISQLGSILNITPTEQEAIDFLLMEEVGRELENE